MKDDIHSERNQSLASLNFDNRFIRELPADPVQENRIRQVQAACYSHVQPTRVSAPQLVSYSPEVAEILNLNPADCLSDDFLQTFVGNRLLPEMEPYACCYGGHQFGNWAGQLGDGRAINLGEIVNQKAERWSLQLKGAGLTPYSRRADGLAVLRSSVREFLCSEAMHHLGVPTTRALSLILTGEQVTRDMFYDGHPKAEPGAVVCRVAPSFTRFGSFQIFTWRNEIDLLRQLADYTIRTDFPHLGPPSIKVYIRWFEEICRRTAEMIVHWMRVGFVHGVMNTDNMSILGLTIDYGPYGWLEDYNPDWTPNTTDAQTGRYRFGHQPQIALWNLAQLANTVYPLIEQAEPLEEALQLYGVCYKQGWQTMMAQKLGLKKFVADVDLPLTTELERVLQLVETDMSIFYRKLADLDPAMSLDNESLIKPLSEAYYQADKMTEEHKHEIGDWLRSYLTRVSDDGGGREERRQRMNAVNPKYVLRNYLAQLAIDKAEIGDYSLVNDLLEVMRNPYADQPENENYAQKRPEWARNRAGCSMLSCSS